MYNCPSSIANDMAPQQQVPADIQALDSQDLTGQVHRADRQSYSKHSGGFSDIFIGVYTKDGNQNVKVAIKVLRNTASDIVEAKKIETYLIREATVWHRLQHPNILKFYGLAPDHGRSGCPALISRYCDNGTIMEYLKENPNLAIKSSMIIGVAEGLRYLHSSKIVHGDLKPSNILVSDEGLPLLCDFGTSRIVTYKGFTTRSKGTLRYKAPELLDENPKCTKPSDVYALVMTCSEIWTGCLPHSDITAEASIILRVLNKGRPPCPSPAPEGTMSLWDLFEQCWTTEPQERLQINDVVKILSTLNII